MSSERMFFQSHINCVPNCLDAENHAWDGYGLCIPCCSCYQAYTNTNARVDDVDKSCFIFILQFYFLCTILWNMSHAIMFGTHRRAFFFKYIKDFCRIVSPGRSLDIHLGKMRNSTMQNFHENNGGAVEAGAPSADNDFASLIKTASEVPPSCFEFHVWSGEGIDLLVDLNSSPSDWTNKFRNEVRICEIVHQNKCRSLWQDLGGIRGNSTQEKCSFLWNTNSVQIDAQNGQTKSSSTLKMTKDRLAELDQQNKGDSPLVFDSLNPCSMNVKAADNLKEVNRSSVSAELTVNMVDSLMQDQFTVSAEVSYGVPNNFVPGAESCAKDASKEIFDLDTTNAPFIKSLCDSFGNSLSNPGTLECQNSKPDDDLFEDCAPLNGSCFDNPSVVWCGASLCSSMELQVSEVASCQKYASVSLCENDGSLDLSDPKNTSDTEQCGPVSSKISFDTDGNNFASLTEDWVGKIVDGRESSEFSQFDNQVKNSGLDCDDHDSEVTLSKKRKKRDTDIEGSSGSPVSRILRSMKNTVARILPRRSMRQIS